MIRCRRLSRLSGDTEGGALLETVIVLPVIMVFMAGVMELALIVNAKQLANYAAFCAARTASVYGLDATARAKAHLAAAMAMSPISPATLQHSVAIESILKAYGLQNPNQAVQVICDIPGFEGDSVAWLTRLASAYVRTGEPTCDTGTAAGKTRKYVEVNVVYIYRCSVVPFGAVLGRSGFDSYVTMLQGLSWYSIIAPAVTLLVNTRRWNIPIHGRAVVDYWAG
jgi:Flp pilus assembly protein TadG